MILPTEIDCPVCGKKAGQHCEYGNGAPRYGDPHKARVKRAEKIMTALATSAPRESK